jgi:hypothetical protein
MLRFNFLFSGAFLVILALLGVVFYVAGIQGIAIFATIGALAFITGR